LRLLTENEIFRLSVWNNPTNETNKGSDLVGNTERTLFEVRISISHH
jgi:phosphatidylinositol 4-kinase